MEKLFDIQKSLSSSTISLLLEKYKSLPENHHEKRVRDMCLLLFDSLSEPFHLLEEHRFLLECGALLHDIGIFINKKKHHKLTTHLILKDKLLDDVPPRLRKDLALLAGSHRKHISPVIYALPLEDQSLLFPLIAILRIADALDHTHRFNTSIEKVYVTPDHLVVIVQGTDLDFIHNKLERKSLLFKDVFSLDILYRSNGIIQFVT